MADDEPSVDIVWINGKPTAGKTWIGDYLQMYHDWHHIDGDEMMHTLPESQETLGLMTTYNNFWFKGKESPDESWKPYYASLISQVKVYRAENPTKCISIVMGVYSKSARDWISSEIEDLKWIMVDVLDDDFVERQKVRGLEFLKANAGGQSVEEFFEKSFGQPYTDENFRSMLLQNPALKGFQPYEDDENLLATISTANFEEIPNQVCQALGLSPTDAIDTQLVCQKNYDRFEEYKEIKQQLSSA